VARAVFASAATPIYFAPLVMRTYAGQCGYVPPDSVSADSLLGADVYKKERAERLMSYLDSEKFPYLHLADGAFADNLGARAILDEVALGDTVTDALRRNGFSRARRMLFIVVDARTGFDETYAQRPIRSASRRSWTRSSASLQPLQLRNDEPDAGARKEMGKRRSRDTLQGRIGHSGLRQVRRGPR
jgi:hypothetical protein